MTDCDACAFLDAVRTCLRCRRPLCLDCMTTHLCPAKMPRRRRRVRVSDAIQLGLGLNYAHPTGHRQGHKDREARTARRTIP